MVLHVLLIKYVHVVEMNKVLQRGQIKTKQVKQKEELHTIRKQHLPS